MAKRLVTMALMMVATLMVVLNADAQATTEEYDFLFDRSVVRGAAIEGLTVNDGSKNQQIYQFTVNNTEEIDFSSFGAYISKDNGTDTNITLNTTGKGLYLKGRILSLLNLKNDDKVKIEYTLADNSSIILADGKLIGKDGDNTFESGTEYTISTTEESVHLDIISANASNYITKITINSTEYDFLAQSANMPLVRGTALDFKVNNGSDRAIYPFTINGISQDYSRFGAYIGSADGGDSKAAIVHGKGLLLNGRILSILNLNNGDKVKVTYTLASNGSMALADSKLIGKTDDDKTLESEKEYTISNIPESVNHLDIISTNGNYVTKIIITPAAETDEKIVISPTVTISGWNYGETPGTPAIDGNSGDGSVTYQYKVKDSSEDFSNYPNDASTIIPGTYTLKASIAETESYQSGEATTEFTVGRGAGSIHYGTANVEKTTEDGVFINQITKVGDGTVSYSSDNTNVATIDANTGEVTIKGTGNATITATVSDGTYYDYESKTATYQITVAEASTNKYTLTITQPSNGYILVDGESGVTSKDIDANGIVKLVAVPNMGYKFDKWSDDATVNPYELTMTTAKELTTAFSLISVPKDNDFKRSSISGHVLVDPEAIDLFDTSTNNNWKFKGKDDGEYYGISIYGISFKFTRTTTQGQVSFISRENYLETSATGVKITIPNLSAGQIVTLRAGCQSATDGKAVSISAESNGTQLASSATSATQAEPGDFKFVVSANGNLVLKNSSTGFQLYSITIRDAYTVSVSSNNADMGTADITTESVIGDGKYEEGTNVEISATEKEGYRFVNWTEGTTEISTEKTHTITGLSADRVLTANFETTPTTISLTEEMITVGSLTYNGAAQKPTVTVTYDSNALTEYTDYIVTVDEKTDAGDYKLTVTGSGNYTGSIEEDWSIAKKALTITAKDQTITVGGNIATGVDQVTAEGLVSSDELTGITLEPSSTEAVTTEGTITPKDAEIKNGEANYDITYKQGKLTITEVPVTTYNITVPAAVNGNSITADVSSAAKNATVTLTIATAENYSLSTITANNGDVTLSGSGNTRTFTMPAANVTITATWTIIQTDSQDSNTSETYTVTESGGIEVSKVTSTTAATSITIPATVGSANVTSIAPNAFDNITKSDVKSVDLSATSIKDITVDRSSGVFSGFPEETMIYMPAGNTAATGQKNVIIDGTCSDFEMKDQSSYNIPKAFTATTATLSRSFTGEKYCTLCLPYDVPASSLGGKIYEFSSIEGTTVKMTEDTDGLNANKPYIFVPNSNANSISASSVTISMSSDPKTPDTDNFTFKGVFGHKEFTADELSDGVYGFAADSEHGASVGQFVKASSGAWIEGMRAYLAYNGDLNSTSTASTRGIALPEVLNVVLVHANGSTTSIGKLELMTAEDGSPVYNLSGQRVDKSYKGIVIQNGKKMIKK